MPSRAVIDDFLAQDHIAVVGVSRNPKAFGNVIYRKLRDEGRTVYAVHPETDSIEGDPCFRSLAAVPDPVDGVVVAVNAAASADVVRAAIARRVPRVWLHRGTGTGAVSDEAVALCRDNGIACVDGACPLMFDEPVGWFHRMHRVFARSRITA